MIPLTGPTARLLELMQRARSLPEHHRQAIAAAVLTAVAPLLASRDASGLRDLRRRAQDERARLIYVGARDFTDAPFAAATLTEQWALARLEMIASPSPQAEILAERRCLAIERFVRDNLPD